mgnify:CR=1 FL=1
MAFFVLPERRDVYGFIVTCDELHVTLEECCKYLGFCLDHLKSQFFYLPYATPLGQGRGVVSSVLSFMLKISHLTSKI